MTDTMPAIGPGKPRKTRAGQRISVKGAARLAVQPGVTVSFNDEIATFMALEKAIAAVARIFPNRSRPCLCKQ
jgi:hypothetical protein